MLLVDGREGFVEGYEVYRGNPPDHDLLVPKVTEYREETGRSPAAVVADRGFGAADVERGLRDLGVRTVAIPRPGRPSPERRQTERGRHFRRLVRWRTGAEGRISHWKRTFGGSRTRFRGIEGATTWVGFGVLAHNLHKVGVMVGAAA